MSILANALVISNRQTEVGGGNYRVSQKFETLTCRALFKIGIFLRNR